MKKVEIISDFGVIFIYDRTIKDMLIPEPLADQVVTSNNVCAVVKTQHYVDGSAFVTLIRNSEYTSSELVFDGEIQSPGKCVSINTAEDEGLLEAEVENTIANLKVWVDDIEHPENVVVFVD